MPGWLGGFVHPALLAGAALALVPLVIHLLNRQRYKPLRWAAMRFVLAAQRRTRRRVQLENLLLLFLRMAGIALLALAVARPFTGAKSPLAALTESRRDVVVVIDGSASTGYRESVETVFERMIARARELVHALDGGRGDRVRLILAGGYPRLLSWTNPDQALAMLDTLGAPTDEVLDLAAAFDEVLSSAREESAGTGQSSIEIRLLTDMQRRNFAPEEARARGATAQAQKRATAPHADARASTGADAGASSATNTTTGANSNAEPVTARARPAALYEELDQLEALGLRVIVEDLGPAQSQPANLGINSVAPLGPLIGPALPSDIGVDVQNQGPNARNGVRVVLEIDGERQPIQQIDIAARTHAQAMFPVVFKQAGEHVLTARLEGDRLAIDDVRSEVISVPPPVRVLLVNGARAAAIDEDEVGYLKAVLEPATDDAFASADRVAPFEAREIEPELLGTDELDLSDFDVIWLANVESLSAAAVERLEHRVAAGSGLIVSLGDRVIPENYNSRLFRADGSGLLPAELKRRVAVPSRRDGYFRVKSFDSENPALAFFADDRWKPLLTEVPIYEFIATRPTEGARVLAALDDEGSHALLVERSYDRGHVLLWTTTIDPAWTRLPESPRTLVPLVHELVRHAAHQEHPPRNVAPGEALVATLASFPRNLQLVRPDGLREALDGEPAAAGSGLWTLPPVPGKETEHIGLYKVEVEGGAPLAFAVQLDPFEGDLERLSGAELDALHPVFSTLQAGDEQHAANPALPQRGELWRWLALTCLGALVLESLWAAWLGQKRSVTR